MNCFAGVRALRALNMRRRGDKLDQIGKQLSVSRERARQLVVRGSELEHEMTSTDPWYELPARVRNALVRDGCKPTPASVYEHLQHVEVRRILNVGRKSLAEIHAWLTKHWDEV